MQWWSQHCCCGTVGREQPKETSGNVCNSCLRGLQSSLLERQQRDQEIAFVHHLRFYPRGFRYAIGRMSSVGLPG